MPRSSQERQVSVETAGPYRTLAALGLLGGYSLSAWLRFDRDARWSALAVLLGSLALMGYGAWVQAGLLRAARRASARGARAERDRGVTADESSESERIRALVEWNEAMQEAGLAEAIREGPLAKAIGLFPVLYFLVCTPLLLFVPASAIPEVSLPVPRFVVALASAATVALALALLLGFFGWTRAKARVKARVKARAKPA